jgi:hypothetical protein
MTRAHAQRERASGAGHVKPDIAAGVLTSGPGRSP